MQISHKECHIGSQTRVCHSRDHCLPRSRSALEFGKACALAVSFHVCQNKMTSLGHVLNVARGDGTPGDSNVRVFRRDTQLLSSRSSSTMSAAMGACPYTDPFVFPQMMPTRADRRRGGRFCDGWLDAPRDAPQSTLSVLC